MSAAEVVVELNEEIHMLNAHFHGIYCFLLLVFTKEHRCSLLKHEVTLKPIKIGFATKFQFFLIKQFSGNPKPSVDRGVKQLWPESTFPSFITRFSFAPFIYPSIFASY